MRERITAAVAFVTVGAAAIVGCTATEPRADPPVPQPSVARIAYSYAAPGAEHPALWTMNPDGSDPLPVGDQTGQFPDWSPDRTHLLFDFFDENGDVHVGRIAPGGGEFVQLTDDAFSGEPDYSPDASTIVVSKSSVADEDAAEFTTTLWVMDADGSDPHPLLDEGEAGYDWEGEYSPDGSEVAFTRYGPARDTTAVFIVRADGTDVRQLTPFDTLVEHPRWSPDGETIVYNLQYTDDLDDPRNGIWVVPASGGEPKMLLASTPERHVIKPDYSPDGARIAFGCYFRVDDNEELCAMDVDGTAVVRLTETPGDENDIVWD